MERLEPILKQKFWILLGFGVILTLTGWYMATSALAKTITERTGSIEASFKTAQSASSGEIPNESWAKRLGAINTDQENSIQETKVSMWKRQRDRMTWPEGITDPGYRQKFSNPMRELFRDSYEDEVKRVWKTVNPFNKRDGSGIVEYPLVNVFVLLKQKPWDVAPPDSETMWNVREDLWLLESLFQAITSVNGGYDIGRADACIHQIDKLELRGGGEKLRDNSGASGGGGGSSGGPMDMPNFAMGMGPGAGGGGGPRSITDGLKRVSPEFDPAEEFGDDGTGAAGSRGGGGGGMAGLPTSSMSMLGGSGPMSGGGGATPAADIKRYLVTDPSLPFKKRGFYMSVKMDHTKIPNLIAELTANERSPWPIEIVRVQMSRLNEDDTTAASRRPMAGMPGMSTPANSIQAMQAMQQQQSSSIGSAAFGGAEFETQGSGATANDFTSNLKLDTGPDLSNTVHAQAMKVALENALKDPVMAQVTICGMFTIFNEAKEPEKPAPVIAPAATTPATEEGDAKAPSADQAPAAESDTAAATPAADAAMESAEQPAESAEMNAEKESAEKADPEMKAEAGEKPGPEPGDKPGKEPKPEPDGDKTDK